MNDKRASVVIIGAGIVGASIAYHLAIQGCTDVLILEKEASEVTGSTARSFAGVRHQFSTELNIRLSQYSIERIKNFTEEVGGFAELRQIGYMLLAATPTIWEQGQRNVALQQSLGVPVELLDPAAIRQIVPQLCTDDLLGATYCKTDGFCDPYGIATGYLRRARALGVRLQCDTSVTDFRLEGERVIGVETHDGLISCDIVVNAAGCWSGELAKRAGLHIPVQPYRRCIYATDPFPAVHRDVPMTVDLSTGFFFRKEQDHLMFSISKADEPVGYNMSVDWDWLETVLEVGVQRLPVLEEANLLPQRCWGGLYEVTPDHFPILGRHPDLPNYVSASGFSGHGVMHSPSTGLVMAEEILDGEAHTFNIDELRITRFYEGYVPSEHNIF